MQAQLLSLMAQFLQNTTPVTNAAVTGEPTDNLSPASMIHTPFPPPTRTSHVPTQLPPIVTNTQLQPTTMLHAPVQLPTTMIPTLLQPAMIAHATMQLPTTFVHTQLIQLTMIVHAPMQL